MGLIGTNQSTMDSDTRGRRRWIRVLSPVCSSLLSINRLKEGISRDLIEGGGQQDTKLAERSFREQTETLYGNCHDWNWKRTVSSAKRSSSRPLP